MASKRSTLQRLIAILYHLQDTNSGQYIIHGPTDPPLLSITLGVFLARQCDEFGDRECLVIPWTNTRWSYSDLKRHTDSLVRGLLQLGVRKGDRLAIIAGNCAEYVSLFFATAQIGAILVTLNNHFTKYEVIDALNTTGCRFLFITPQIGTHSLDDVLTHLSAEKYQDKPSTCLEDIIILRGAYVQFKSYDDVIRLGNAVPELAAKATEAAVRPDDICNLQFTSGSTGRPKAAMLTHFNLLNNSRFIGDRMDLTSADVLCCPPPLFHCFGLVLGMLAVITHGAKLVVPSEAFDPSAVVQALSCEKCTALHGVPTMFEAILATPRPPGWTVPDLRTGIIAGAPVSRQLMRRLVKDLNMTEFTSSYGLTEASPTCFNAHTMDSIDTRLETVGQIMPHATAKVVNSQNEIVPFGERGELCISGYQVTKGYWNNPGKTSEVLVTDNDGRVWLKTGDEAVLDQHGYCKITGRLKDIIIRGGENIYPPEIESCLAEHAAVDAAYVVGVPDPYYGEAIAAFLCLAEGYAINASLVDDLRNLTGQRIGRHKRPSHVFAFGVEGVPNKVPLTASGKIRKPELKVMCDKVLKMRRCEREIS